MGARGLKGTTVDYPDRLHEIQEARHPAGVAGNLKRRVGQEARVIKSSADPQREGARVIVPILMAF